MKPSTILTTLMTAILLVPAMAFATAPFQDVLDVPAVKSALAAKTLLVGVTLAGKRIVSVGQRGHIVYSDDQGKSWTQASVPVSSDLLAVHFPTPQKGGPWVMTASSCTAPTAAPPGRNSSTAAPPPRSWRAATWGATAVPAVTQRSNSPPQPSRAAPIRPA